MSSTNTSNVLTSTLTTNFDVAPYFDDFDIQKGFYRILFKPGYAIQARELTQIQSILQNQITQFGKHVFKEGSIVYPGAFNIRSSSLSAKGNPIDYVKINDNDTLSASVDVAAFKGQTVRGTTSNVHAYVIDTIDTDGTASNNKTLYVTYLSASDSNPNTRTFLAGETLTSANVGTAIVKSTDPVANTGYGSWFSIEAGVFFAKDHFIYFPGQSVVLDRYNPLPKCKVGFLVSEKLVDSTSDTSLLDPALESSNYSAPGADRLQLQSDLMVVDYDFADNQDFVSLFTIKDGVVQSKNDTSDYNVLGDSLASRTYNESGDYVVKGLNIQVAEHDIVTVPVPNYGRNANGNNSLLVVSVDPGIGYVKGYAVQNYDRIDINVEKPKDYRNAASQVATTTMGQSLRVNEVVGSWQIDQSKRINFYDLVQKRVANTKWSSASQTGNNIGSGIINSIQYVSGTPGYNAIYDVYLSDIKMVGANSFSNVRSLFYDHASVADTGADVYGATNLTSVTSLQDVNKAPLLYYVGSNSTKAVRDNLGNPATTYNFGKTSGISSGLTMASGGTMTITLSGPANEIFPYGSTVLSDTDVLQDIILTTSTAANIAMAGTISASGTAVTGVGTAFTNLNVGDKIEIAGQPTTWIISAIADNTHLTTANTIPASVTGNSYFKAYKVGDLIDMSGKGCSSGTQRTVTATPTTLAFDMKETLPSTLTATASYMVSATDSTEASKTLTVDRYVGVNCASAGVTGPFNLGLSDVYQIKSITHKSGSAPSSTSDGTDVTSYFILNNGQKDTMYDLASITPSAGAGLTTSSYLLVKLDYFVPSYSGKGSFFSVNSYPIQDDDALASSTTIRTENIPVYTSSTSGLKYDLRNFLDFRPVKAITANDATTVGNATYNPTSSNTYNFISASGMHFPVPSSQLTYDYSYYLPRRDIVVVDKTGVFSVINGTPSANPTTPTPLDTQMILGVVNIPAYPSLSPSYGNALGRKDLACVAKKTSNRVYTMRDIGILDQRIKSLEEYTSLTLLEKDATSLKVTDINGLDRFKNGIFVDTFKDASLSAKGVDQDYRIVTDPIELCIRPLFSTESVGYDYISGSGVKLHDDGVVTINYTETLQFSQTRATDIRNLERATFAFNGQITLFPNQDVWVDTSFAPDEIVSISATDALLEITSTSSDTVNDKAAITKNLINTVWGSWQTAITGYNLYRGDGASKVLVGTYTTEEAARNAAASWTTVYNSGTATIETLYSNSRLGTNYFSNTSADEAVGSTSLKSSTVIPYIRPQVITVKVANLKPRSQMHVFFDATSVSSLCTPLTYAQYEDALAKRPIIGGSAEGSALIVNADGNLYFNFRIPSDTPKFRTGERKLIVIDGLQLLNGDISEADVSTSASTYFFAQGTAETLQRTVYSTKGYLKTVEPDSVSQSYNSSTSQVIPNTGVPPIVKGHNGSWYGWWRGDTYVGHCCFNPDAKVLMADKSWKAIKDIVVGDKVIGDKGVINTVEKNKTIGVGIRKMIQIKGTSFYTTDDHLFLTKKGWKTWRPDILLESGGTTNWNLLIGDNRVNGIDSSDQLKTLDFDGDNIIEKFVPVDFEVHEFDPFYQVHDLTLDGNMSYIVEGYVVHNCCCAYTVMVRAPSSEEGIFVSSFDIFVGRKSATRGLWFEIREVDNSGGITTTSYPGSVVRVENASITESSNGKDNPLNVKFDSPLFLFNNKEYAFVVHSDSPSLYSVDPDTMIWVSRLGEIDVNTKASVSERQGAGNFFQTSDNVKWDKVTDVDLTCNVYRAEFDIGEASFYMGSQPLEKLHLTGKTQSLSSKIGSYFISGDTITLSGANGTIYAGNTLYGNVSTISANSKVLASLGGNKYLMANTRYAVGEKIDVYNNGSYAKVTATVTAVANASGKLVFVDESQATATVAEFTNSSGGFVANSVLHCASDMGVTANVAVVNDYRYSAISFQPKALDFTKTDIQYSVDTYNKGATSSAGYDSLVGGDTHFFNTEKSLYCRTNEALNISSNPSNKIRVDFQSLSSYVSPVVDLEATHTIFIDNILNANTLGETGKAGGQAYNKYISQSVALADGQDAEDINVYLTSYRPPGSDVLVYVKLLHADDPDPLAQKSWTLLEKSGDGDGTYSSLSDRNNYIEYIYNIPAASMTGPLGEYQYISNGITYTGYKYFAVKIVLSGTDTAVFPKVADLRVLCLQL